LPRPGVTGSEDGAHCIPTGRAHCIEFRSGDTESTRPAASCRPHLQVKRWGMPCPCPSCPGMGLSRRRERHYRSCPPRIEQAAPLTLLQKPHARFLAHRKRASEGGTIAVEQRAPREAGKRKNLLCVIHGDRRSLRPSCLINTAHVVLCDQTHRRDRAYWHPAIALSPGAGSSAAHRSRVVAKPQRVVWVCSRSNGFHHVAARNASS
jgi:hypothetical protein